MPATLDALVIVFTLSVPSYLAILFFRARNPVHYYRETQSTVEQISLYVFLGTSVNILVLFSIGLLFPLALLIRNILPSGIFRLLDISFDSPGGFFVFTGLLTIAYFAAGIGFSYLLGDILGRFLPYEAPLWMSELNKLKIIQAARDKEVKWLLVHLKNGDRFLGLVREVRWIGDQDNAMELTLDKAFHRLVDSSQGEKVGRVLLRSEDILWLSHYSI